MDKKIDESLKKSIARAIRASGTPQMLVAIDMGVSMTTLQWALRGVRPKTARLNVRIDKWIDRNLKAAK